jgi:hypothetical protein
VTSQKAQIQALINGIDEVLTKNSPRLPWVMSNDAMQQRQVLEQTRQYLTSLQQQLDEAGLPAGMAGSLTASITPLIAASQASSQASQASSQVAQAGAETPAESAQQVLQAVLQEMNYWRVNMLQPLRTEVDSLQRQREVLTQEIRQLEIQRQQQQLKGYAQAEAGQNQQLIEFLQAAMGQMQANLSGQVTQMIAAQTNSSLSASDPGYLVTSPAERLTQVQQMQSQSDQLMLKLDSTLQVIFESLNRNVQTYQESLEQGLDRMHSLGQQGEAMFAFLVNRLAQQLGREASTFLQAGAPTSGLPTPDAAGSSTSEPGAANRGANSDFKVADFLQSPATTSHAPAMPFNLSEEVLDIAALESLGDAPDTENALTTDLHPDLSPLSQELSQLELSASLEAAEPYDLFSGDQPLATAAGFSSQNLADGHLPNPESSLESSLESSSELSTELSTDLDSALDLLNQLSAEMQADSAIEQQAGGDRIDAEASSNTAPDSVAELAADLANEPELITAPDSLYDQAFYNNLFQNPTGAAGANRVEEVPSSDMTLSDEWFGGLGDLAQDLVQDTGSQETGSSAASAISAEPETLSSLADDLAGDFASVANYSVNHSAGEQTSWANSESTLPVVESDHSLDLGMTVEALAELGSGSLENNLGQSAANRVDLSGVDSGEVTLEGLENLFADLSDVVDPTDEEKKNL